MPEELGAWLRQQREARGWPRPEMARQLIKAAQARGDTSVPGVDSMCHNIYRWERGADGLSDRYKLHYCHALGITPSQFGPGQPDQRPDNMAGPVTLTLAVPAGLPSAASLAQMPSATPGVVDPRTLLAAAFAYRDRGTPDLGDSVVEREVWMAAHEGSDHAEQAEEHGIGETTFEQLRADVVRLSHLTDTAEPFGVFLDLRRVRARIYRLLDRRLWPREQTDLYFLLGCLNGLMGLNASRLGYPDAAEELIRAGMVYATAIGHPPLMAHMRVKFSHVAYWRGNFSESRDMATAGLEYLSRGPGGADLYINQARAAARLGDADTARQAVASSHDALEPEYSDDLTQIGGEEFDLSMATHHGMAGQALAEIPEGDPQAAGELERALRLYDEGPPGRSWFGGKPLAGINLAVIRLRSGALDAAAASLDWTFTLAPGQRTEEISARLAVVRAELAAPIFRGSPQARDLQERIEEFVRESVVAGLHSLPGGPG